MRKRVLSLVLVLLMVLSFFSVMPLSVSAATEYKSSYYTYILSDNQATITDVGVEISGSVVIPSSLNGYAVIAIGSNAFDDCDSLTSVALPSTVKTIGYHAFFACDMLTTITLGNNVTEIGEAAFANCTRLKSIEIPNSVTKMGRSAFYNCGNLATAKIGSGLYEIPNGAFDTCKSLSTLTISDGVETIESNAFNDCDSLTSVVIPNTVKTVGYHAFFACDALMTVSLGNSVTEIAEGAFANCTRLKSIAIPNSVTKMGRSVFYNCDNLSTVTIGSGLYEIPDSSFSDCSNLIAIKIGSAVNIVDRSAFYGCESLLAVEIPKSVKNIEYSAFNSCDSLANVYYQGNQSDWNNIIIGDYNEDLLDAKIHYNSVIPSSYFEDANNNVSEKVNCSLDLEWGRDNFSFENDPDYLPVHKDENGNYVYEMDYSLFSHIGFVPSDILAAKNHLQHFGGACFGMSVLTYKNATDNIDIGYLQNGKKTLFEISSPKTKGTDNLRNAIGLYQGSVATSKYNSASNEFINLPTQEKLEILFNKLLNIEQTQTPILIDYAWISDEEAHEKSEGKGISAHAVLAYAIENDYAPYNVNNDQYEYRVWVINPNESFNSNTSISEASRYCIYIKGDLSEFCIPVGGTRKDTEESYSLVSTDNAGDMKGLGDATLQFVTDDYNLLPPTESDNNYIIVQSLKQSVIVNGTLISGYKGTDSSILSRSFIPAGEEAAMSLVMSKNALPKIKTVDDGQTVGIMDEDSAMFVTANKNSLIDVSKEKTILTNASGRYLVEIASNSYGDNYNDIIIEGEGSQEIAFCITDVGLYIEGDNLSGTTITTDTDETTINTNEKEVLIKEENDELVISDASGVLGDANKAGVIINGTLYNVEVGDTITYDVYLRVDQSISSVQATITYDKTKLSVIPAADGWYEEGKLSCPNLNGTILNTGIPGVIKFNSTSIKRNQFIEEKLFATFKFTVVDAGYSEIDLCIEEMDHYFSYGVPVVTEGIVIKELISKPDSYDCILGDANGDGKVNVKDATEIQKAVAGLLTLDETEEVAADVDGSGKVNVKDATAIQKWVAGIETGFAIGEGI